MVIYTILYPIIAIVSFCHEKAIVAFSPAYKRHMYKLNLQNLHLDGDATKGRGRVVSTVPA
jgi:hypothetical protein